MEKMPKVNDHPMDENWPNLVTLEAGHKLHDEGDFGARRSSAGFSPTCSSQSAFSPLSSKARCTCDASKIVI
jgi:hypothetical protein